MKWFLVGFLVFLFLFILVFVWFVFTQNKKKSELPKKTTSKIIMYIVGIVCLVFTGYMLYKTGSKNMWDIVAPYIWAPILAVVGYFFTDKGYRRMDYAIVVTIVAASIIFLLSNPWFFGATTKPFSIIFGDLNHCKSLYFMILTVFAGLFVGILSGRVLETLLFGLTVLLAAEFVFF